MKRVILKEGGENLDMEVEEAELEEWIRSALMSSYIPKCFFFSFVMKRSEYYSIHSDGATFL